MSLEGMNAYASDSGCSIQSRDSDDVPIYRHADADHNATDADSNNDCDDEQKSDGQSESERCLVVLLIS